MAFPPWPWEICRPPLLLTMARLLYVRGNSYRQAFRLAIVSLKPTVPDSPVVRATRPVSTLYHPTSYFWLISTESDRPTCNITLPPFLNFSAFVWRPQVQVKSISRL